jgi:hypothetical protein
MKKSAAILLIVTSLMQLISFIFTILGLNPNYSPEFLENLPLFFWLSSSKAFQRMNLI